MHILECQKLIFSGMKKYVFRYLDIIYLNYEQSKYFFLDENMYHTWFYFYSLLFYCGVS